MSSMVYLVLAVVCGLAIGMIFKHAGLQGLDRVALLTVNYAAALAIAVLLLASGMREAAGALEVDVGLFALGGATGMLFILGFFLLSVATDVAGMSLAIGVMRVSVVVPFLASWLIWSEVPSLPQGAGLMLAGVAFFLIASRGGRTVETASSTASVRTLGVLAALFVASGTIDVLLKTFDEVYRVGNSRAFFLLLVFGVAFAVGAAIVVGRGVRRGQWPHVRTLGWGVLLGAVNYGSVEFLLRAIRELSGPFVFPANHIALIVGAALLGVLVWNEHLSRRNWFGLGLAAIALVLLNL